jgi:hypothetical protein
MIMIEVTLTASAEWRDADDRARFAAAQADEAAGYHAATADALDLRDYATANLHADGARIAMRSIFRAVRDAQAAGDESGALYCKAMFSAARASADAAEAAIAWAEWRDADDRARFARVQASAATASAEALLDAAHSISKRAAVQRQRAAEAAQAAQYDADLAAQAAADAI